MRMDRYTEDLTNDDFKKTRTNKNQELYADVYLNNVYVNINDLKEAMYENTEEKEKVKVIKEEVVNNYTYEDNIYDINLIVEDAIKNKKDDNLKRSLDKRVDDLDIKNLIESINENQRQKEVLEEQEEVEKKEQNDNLLTDLLPENNDTLMIESFAEPVLDKEDLDAIALKGKQEFNEELNDNLLKEKDESFLIENDSSNKTIWIIISIILVMLIIVVLVFWKLDIFQFI